MPIAFIEPKRKKYYLILLLIVIVIGASYLIWNFLFLRRPTPPLKPLPPKEVKINFETLKNPILEKLQPFERIPPFEEKPGRENPFLPY